MNNDTSRVPERGAPILRILTAFPIACFAGALVTDIAYTQTADMMWTDFSAWLLAVGIGGAVLAALVGIVHVIGNRHRLTARPVWAVVIGGLLVMLLAFADSLVHSRDAWTSVMPEGLALSAATVLVMIATVWLASMPSRRIGVDATYAAVRS